MLSKFSNQRPMHQKTTSRLKLQATATAVPFDANKAPSLASNDEAFAILAWFIEVTAGASVTRTLHLNCQKGMRGRGR